MYLIKEAIICSLLEITLGIIAVGFFLGMLFHPGEHLAWIQSHYNRTKPGAADAERRQRLRMYWAAAVRIDREIIGNKFWI